MCKKSRDTEHQLQLSGMSSRRKPDGEDGGPSEDPSFSCYTLNPNSHSPALPQHILSCLVDPMHSPAVAKGFASPVGWWPPPVMHTHLFSQETFPDTHTGCATLPPAPLPCTLELHCPSHNML